jgi:Flp pilus assembly pilin Flp
MNSSNLIKKNFSQKGQGLVEYALLIGFVGALALFVMMNGGFSGAINTVFDSAKNILSTAIGSGSDDSSSDETSFDYETLTADDVSPPTYKTLNWQEIIMGVPGMYGTVMGSDTAAKAIISETNLFAQISTMVEDHLASTKAEDGTKDWETMMANMEKMQSRAGFSSSYVRGEETFTIQRMGTSNAVIATHTNGKDIFTYYKLSPDDNNVMQIETNSDKSFGEYMSTIAAQPGWEYKN